MTAHDLAATRPAPSPPIESRGEPGFCKWGLLALLWVAFFVLGWMSPRVGLAAGLSSLAGRCLFGAACELSAIIFSFRRDYVGPADLFLKKR